MHELNSATLKLNGSHLIEASAGTGKTFNIVRIYLRLLLEKEYSVNEILVMTFTVAATAELRNRLNTFLRETLLNWDTSTDQVVCHLRTTVSKARAELLLKTAIAQLDEAAIYTIHGFCKRVLSQQAFFSGISFQADMGADTLELKRLAAEDWYRNIQTDPKYASIAEKWPTPESFIQQWNQVIESSEPLNPPIIEDLAVHLELHLADWSTERDQFHALNKITARTAADTLTAYTVIVEELDAIEKTKQLPGQLHTTAAMVKKAFSTQKKTDAMPAAYALLKAISHNTDAHEINLALGGIRYIRDHIAADKNRLDQLDFNDLIVELSKVLHGPFQEELRKILRTQFPAALVDEFQDTDPEQYAIIHAIYNNVPDSFVCMIGDPKQAIYGFRGGDVFAYLQARHQVDYEWTMNTNYRSTQALISGYNQIFLQGKPELNNQTFGFNIEYRKVLANPDAQAPIYSDDNQRAALQWVHLQPDEYPKKGLNKSFQQSIARWCVQEIIHLLSDTQRNGKPVAAGSIALLVRGFREAELLQSQLTQAGLASVYLSSRANIFETNEANDLAQLLQGIWQYENDRKFIAALASRWLNFTTAELDQLSHNEHEWAKWQNRFEQWRHEWQDRGLMSMLLNILQASAQSDGQHSDRQLTNMLHLAERLQKESTRLKRPDALLHWFEQARMDDSHHDENQLRLESDEALIKIITMHGAKGLEYPIVFLPFISYHGAPKKAASIVRYHHRETLAAHLTLMATPEEKSLSNEEDEAERIRLLYVAATRAAERLYCCVAPFSSFKSSPLALSIKADEYNLQQFKVDFTVEHAANFLDVTESEINHREFNVDAHALKSTPATFNGHIERDWWLSSFSSLTRNISHSIQTTPDRDDDKNAVQTPGPLPLRFRLAKGAEAGNLLHDALEHAEFTEPDWNTLWKKTFERYRSLADTFDLDEFKQWLGELLQAPLTDTCSLSMLAFENTLRESEFYFPMGGANMPRLAEIISQHRGSEFSLPERNKLKGMMHGFIDLIFELDGRYYVADYKSTYLGDRLEDYHQQAMRGSIENSHYDVQYLIYSLALHRYLKVRLKDYDPRKHFGGVYYLYLRGMNPNSQHGIYYAQVDEKTLHELDTVFANTETETPYETI